MEGTVTEDPTEVENSAEMEAAFAASVNDDADQLTEVTPVSESERAIEESEEVEATPTAPPHTTLSEEQIRLLATIPELERRLQGQVDKVAGNYGEVKRALDSITKAAATPKSAAEFEASVDGDFIDTEFPELGGSVNARIEKKIAQLAVGMTPEQMEVWYTSRRQQEDEAKIEGAIQVLHDAHPDRFEIQQAPIWKQWIDGLAAHERQGVMNSQDPYYVSGMISKFKDFRAKQVSQDVKNKQRIDRAIAPTSGRPASPSTTSEDEAAQAAFEAQFN